MSERYLLLACNNDLQWGREGEDKDGNKSAQAHTTQIAALSQRDAEVIVFSSKSVRQCSIRWFRRLWFIRTHACGAEVFWYIVPAYHGSLQPATLTK